MGKWFTSFILTAVIVGSVMAGVHSDAGEHKCPLMGVSDCCQTAGSQSTVPTVSAARLCCALNCTEPGTTAPSGASSVSGSQFINVNAKIIPPRAIAAACATPAAPSLIERHLQAAHPVYIRHLALLI